MMHCKTEWPNIRKTHLVNSNGQHRESCLYLISESVVIFQESPFSVSTFAHFLVIISWKTAELRSIWHVDLHQNSKLNRLVFDPFVDLQTPDSWTPWPALMGLGPSSISGRVVDQMASKPPSSTRQRTRHHHPLFHSDLVFIFQSEQPFCFPESAESQK